MHNELTLSDIEGLFRRCSPVVDRFTGKRGVLAVQESPGVWRVIWDDQHGIGLRHLSTLALDLTDATGRAHAAWWLHKWARTQGMVVLLAVENALGLWLQAGWSDSDRRVFWDSLDDWLYLSGDLDPNDLRLLDDGGRWVDAEALKLVCVHVAGIAA